MCLTIREVVACYTKTLRHLVQSVTEKEIDMIGNTLSLRLINKKSFTPVHICAALNHSSDMAFNLSPAHFKNRVFLCRCTKACLHSVFIKPYGYGILPKSKALTGSTVLSL